MEKTTENKTIEIKGRQKTSDSDNKRHQKNKDNIKEKSREMWRQ